MVIFYQNKPCQKLLFQGEEMKRGGWIKQQRKKTMRSKKIEWEDVILCMWTGYLSSLQCTG